MTATISAAPYDGHAMRLVVVGDPESGLRVVRTQRANAGSEATGHWVRGTVTIPHEGWTYLIDWEPPLGGEVFYELISGNVIIANTPWLDAPRRSDGLGTIHDPLNAAATIIPVEGQAEARTEWATTSVSHRVQGSATPVVVGDVRQRRRGTLTFLCKSHGEADRLVATLPDASVRVLRFDQCAQAQVRDLIFTPFAVTEDLWGRQGKRLVAVDWQEVDARDGGSGPVPPFGWTFDDLLASAPTFDSLLDRYADFDALLADERL